MGKLWNDKMCEEVTMDSLNVDFRPLGHGNPTVWRIAFSATFTGYDANGNTLGIVSSSDVPDAKLPFLTVVDGLPSQPSFDIIVAYMMASGEQNLKTWFAKHRYRITGNLKDGYKIDDNGEVVLA